MSGYVYFVRNSDNDVIKIGFASNLGARIASLQTGNPELLVLVMSLLGSREEEKQIHERFSSKRLRGEWFSLDAELEEFLDDLIDARAALGFAMDERGALPRPLPAGLSDVPLDLCLELIEEKYAPAEHS